VNSRLYSSFAWALVLGYMGVIFYLSHQPSVPIPPRFPHQDKVFHFLAYFLLAMLVAGANQEGGRKRRFFSAFIVAALYGISDEIHQSFVPGRDASVLDWIADAGGGWVGAYFYLQLEHSFRARRK
jgi:VanZ family protein